MWVTIENVLIWAVLDTSTEYTLLYIVMNIVNMINDVVILLFFIVYSVMNIVIEMAILNTLQMNNVQNDEMSVE